jgi:hypothetical protein
MGKIDNLPQWAIDFRKWGKPIELAKRLDCSVDVVLRAYNGDREALWALIDGTASHSGKRIFPPFFSGPFETISPNRRKRPKWMSKQMHERLIEEVWGTDTLGKGNSL